MSVQVAVRVRPFNQREIDLQTKLCVEMKDNRTTIKNFEDQEKNKDFFFDYSFWSHDGFKTLPDGFNVPDSENSIYADQRKVYNCLGESVLNQAWQGYNVVLFAYGQTGSGKSYSVMGYKPNVGIVPIACKEIFERIRNMSEQQKDIQQSVDFGMMEIYNERVQDLQISIDKRPQQGMKIRESQSLGFYAEGLRKIPVISFEDIEKRMDEGSKNRSVAATQMNANSSRAHTIIQIELKQIINQDGRKIERLSVINLVDLAGSEKVGKTGASGDRLKEAANINKSLSMLGMVISALADIDSGKIGKKVPYRDSALTKLLANALGGNAKTIMICAISPSSDNYEESLSTLRYADQAKKIKNKAQINETGTDKLIRELREENQRLKGVLQELEQQMKSGNFDANDPETMQKFLDLQENIMGNNKMIENQSKSDEERRLETQKEDDEKSFKIPEIDKTQPYMTNLNEDPQLNNMMDYPLVNPQTTLGNQKGYPLPDIVLNGLGIRQSHCIFMNENGSLYLVPGNDETIQNYLHLNGQKVSQKVELKHNDRIIIGTQGAFLIKIPNTQPREDTINEKDIDWDFAQNELTSQQGKIKKKQEELQKKQMNQSMEQRLKQLEEKHQQEIDDLEREKKNMAQQYEQRIAEIQAGKENPQLQKSKTLEIQAKFTNVLNQFQKKQTIRQEEYIEQKQKFLAQELVTKLQAKKEKKKLELELANLMPKLNEMNLIAEELGRDVKFVLKMGDNTEQNLKIKVENKETGTKYTWDVEKALDRYYCLKDQLDDFGVGNNKKNLNNEQDPFWDPPDPNLLGKSVFRLAPVAFNMDNPEESWILEEKTDKIRGLLKVNIIPSSADGKINLCDDNKQISNPLQNLGKTINIKIVIQSAKLGDNVGDTYVEYNFQGTNYTTKIVEGQKKNPNYNYTKIHSIKVTNSTIDYLLKSNINFKVYGIIDFKRDFTFLGKKDLDQNIGEDPSQKKKMEEMVKKAREKKQKEIKKRSEELKKKKKKEVKAAAEDEDDQPFHKQKGFWVTFSGVCLLIVYIVFVSICASYKNSFEELTPQDELLLVKNQEINYNQWRTFNVMMLSSAVMITFISINGIVAKCMPMQLKELGYTSVIPFVIWFISTVVWLTADSGYYQFKTSEIYQERGFCYQKETSKPCIFIWTYFNMISTAIGILIVNSIIYFVYLRTKLKWAKERKEFLDELKQQADQSDLAEQVGLNKQNMTMNPLKNENDISCL